ncbi:MULTISPECIES: hypothetical protein [unclassified Acinetobacter]|uniref:hypothetical protein n=1 Tax=unclassified Acinetobacter TaxID=196816 RepID=UPI00244A7E3F|nr:MULTISPECIES: hypothetical protein [unclassified Acinetobacter]MDH0032541.1 hypothetical protein [Acinetobacter sp. GD04021]MDH0885232.1 hypothetical protein [Acinetobacter sp. GD03873]MDH1084440.1 hypothetical protein [Acinetobacter sp. GD03983]MDH2188328.1 hypothetical protein [Acinetobacter sp. GD03645]MDH2203839.1 hypothetical protein [Acinetobacter sp. GD03647]
MIERPILFNTAMVQAILSGQKTQTRRVVKNELIIDQAEFECGNRPNVTLSEPNLQYRVDNWCPYGQIGDRLWVRETFRLYDSDECPHADFPCGCPRHGTPLYKASHDCGDGEKWKPSIHMPRWASRILLEITNIRVERVQDITTEDAKAEGFDYSTHPSAIQMGYAIGAKTNFRITWEQIYGQNEWNKNPWVWVVEFKVVQGGAV